MDKAVAIFAIVFFVFYGIPMPTSYATAVRVAQNERQQLVPVVSYDLAAAADANEAVTPQPEIPSGAAIQNSNALYPVTDSVVVDAQLLSVIRVRAGESIQIAIDQAKSGDTVYVDAGVYTQSFVLKQGVNLQGENPETTILDGGGRNEDLITAMGDNRIEGFTITGGAVYSGNPYSAIRVEGDNVTVANNIIKDNLNYAIYLRSGQNAVIEQNLFLNNELAIQHPLTMATGASIRNNTFV